MYFVQQSPDDYNDEGQHYLLTGKLNGRHYSAAANNTGDYYDLESVLRFVNAITIVEGAEERFVGLPSVDQTVHLVMFTVALVETLMDKRLLPFDAMHRKMFDPDQAKSLLM
jgi:hypothetical protein